MFDDGVINALERDRAKKGPLLIKKVCTATNESWHSLAEKPCYFTTAEAKQAITSENAVALKNHSLCRLIDHFAS